MSTSNILKLRYLIVHDMDGAKHQMTDPEMEVWIETLPQISQEMKEGIHFIAHMPIVGSIVRRRIDQINKECVSLLDDLDKLPLPDTENTLAKALRIGVQFHLEELMEHLHELYPGYLDADFRLPIIQLRRQSEELRNILLLIRAGFNKHGIDNTLSSLIIQCIEAVVKLKRVSYRRMEYLTALQLKILEVLKTEPVDSQVSTEMLAWTLVTEDFNHPHFTRWFMTWMRSCLDKESNEEQDRLLSRWENKCRHATYRKNMVRYDKDYRKCQTILMEFLKIEKSRRIPEVSPVPPAQTYYERPAPQPFNSGAKPQQQNSTKVNFLFSVEALAYLIKLLIGAKVIEAGIKTELFAAFASLFQTAGTAENGISAGSLNTKFKNVTQTTAKNLRAALMKMVALIDEEFE